jgi:hypothetical protein
MQLEQRNTSPEGSGDPRTGHPRGWVDRAVQTAFEPTWSPAPDVSLT